MKLELISSYLEHLALPTSIRKAWIRRLRGIRRTGASVDTVQRRLFVDLSVIRHHDAGTGIQRVVRALALALSKQGAGQFDVQFVAATRKRAYHRIPWPDELGPADLTPIYPRPNDVFLGLDYALDTVRWHRGQLAQFRKNGCQFWFLAHDLLPLQKPEWFSANTIVRYRKWLQIVATLADGIFCNSTQTKDEITQVFAELYGIATGYRTVVLPMSPFIDQSLHACRDNPRHESEMRPAFRAPFVMMVGTLEPRKGHIDVIRAFELLWSKGSTQNLILVGRAGWKVDQLQELLVGHPEMGRKLFWFADVDDGELIAAYQASDGVVIASYGEGFGLPLIEALGYGTPVLARDLPIFRVHEAHGVQYFPSDATVMTLADSLDDWLKLLRDGAITVSPPHTGWPEATRTLASALS